MSSVFALTLIITGMIGGLVAPYMVRSRTKKVIIPVIGWVWWFLFTIIISQVILAFISFSVDDSVRSKTYFTVSSQIITYLVALAFMILLPYLIWKEQKKSLKSKKKVKKSTKRAETRQFVLALSGLSRKPAWNDIKQFLFLFPLYFMINLMASLVLTLMLGSEIMGQVQNVGFAKTGNSPLMLTLIFIGLVILVPFFEEMLTRGALFTKLREKIKFWPTALVTAGIFALIHGQFNVGVMTFILAMYAAYLREKTGAIWSGIMLHSTQNLIAFCLLFL